MSLPASPPVAASVGNHLVLVSIDENERPVAIRALGAYAESLGIRVTLLVIIRELATFGNPVVFSASEVRALASWLAKERVTHLGFSLMTAGLRPFALLTQALRGAGYRGVILAGGVHVALHPDESLVEGADFAVQGPGELPLRLLFEGAKPGTIPGLVWRRSDGTVAVNGQTADQKLELDALPYPIYRFGTDMILAGGRLRRLTWRLHRRHATWDGGYYDMLTSRGCDYRCAYCCNVNGAPVRRASVDHVIGELLAARQAVPGTVGVNFQDDSFFTGSEEWMERFCVRMKAEVGLPFIARMIPRYVTPARIRRLKEAGLEYVTMGLEASDRINKTVFNRHETAAGFVQAAKIILAEGIYLSTDVIIDNPYETENDLRAIAMTLNALPRPHWGVVALSLTAFPGTALRTIMERDGMIERLATDPYDSMLISSRPGGYRTPRFWLLLNTQILRAIPPSAGAHLIAAGPRDARAAQMVERLAAQMRLARRISAFTNAVAPWLRPLAGRALAKTADRQPTRPAGGR